MLQKLIIQPDQNGYSVMDGNEVLSVQLDGGASKFRQDILNSVSKVSVQWSLDAVQFNYIRSFYKYSLKSGSLPFLLDLYIDNPFELTEHVCHIVPGTFALKSQAGQLFVVGCTIEVEPITDQILIDAGALYGLFGEEYVAYNDTFDKLMNVDIPADFV